jgi:glycosyltransferase involved in cell wall biosynthesis
MKVALICNYWKNSNGGGIKTYVVNLAEALKNKGIDINVLFREGKDPEQFYGGRNKIGFSFACYQHLKKIHPEVIHSHGAWYCLLPGVIYKKLRRCTLVFSFHSAPEKKWSLPVRIIFQILLNNCDCVTFVSKGLKEKIVEIHHLSLVKTAITYGGARASDVSENEVAIFRRQFGIDDDAIVLLAQGMTAHILKASGLKLLIQTIGLLCAEYPNILLIATREAKCSEEVKAFTREIGMEDRVIFTGNLENPYVPLKFCNLYTQITMGEGLGLALLEAMAMGRPIIATSVGGIPEAITDGLNGLLVTPEVHAIAQKIDSLLRNPEYGQELGRQAQRTVEERFTWELTAERFIDVYKNK